MGISISAWISFVSISVSTLAGCGGPDLLQEVANVPGLRVWNIHAEGDLLYAATEQRGLIIFDISEPEQIREIGSLVPSDLSAGLALAVAGQYAYLGTTDAIFTIDVSNPSQPVEVGRLPGRTGQLAAQGDYLYCFKGSDLEVVDVSMPSAPQLVGELTLEIHNGSLAVSGNLAVIGDGLNEIHMVDISNPLQPTWVGAYEAGGVGAVAIDGDLVYGAASDQLMIIDIADPAQPRLRGCHASSCSQQPTSVSVQDGYAYVTGQDCLEVYDVSDPGSLRLTAMLDALVPINYWDVVASNGYIFLAHLGGLRIFPHKS